MARLLVDESYEIGKQIKAKPVRCYHNAISALHLVKHPDPIYVEGWVTMAVVGLDRHG